jgi:acyl transferase domain-containing protein
MAAPSEHLSLVKRALIEVREARARLEAARAERHEPIAVIGIGCRFPGSAATPDAFWALLEQKRDAIRDVPADRPNLDASTDGDSTAGSSHAMASGGFLDGIELFDHGFFGISPREAATMDPQQRLVLEVAWEALEDAGICPDELMGAPVGVFIGAGASDYLQLSLRSTDPRSVETYLATGGVLSVIAGRLAYFLGTQGPAVVVDTACSGSLVAVHQACRSLRHGESRMAVAGGVAAMLLPELTANFARAGMLSAHSRCKTFDAAADGYVRSEGCGLVVLKRLTDARADRDRVLAVIRGSAVNQDGRSGGLTVPNGLAQEAVITAALADARLQPADIDYVEAHGTGTPLGDPIEVLALARALGRGRDPARPLLLGSVKTNVGHLEAAAGIAGLIKVVLSLERGELPPNLHFQTPNPHIDWERLPVRVVTEPTPWADLDSPRRAGVSSFGFSGTNAHVVLESAPPETSSGQTEAAPRVQLLPMSARSASALRTLASRYVERFSQNPRLSPHAVCRTASSGRRHFPHRLAVAGSSLDEIAAGVNAWLAAPAPLSFGKAGEMRIAFAFSGQGSQYPGMGRELYDSSAVFRDAVTRCDDLLRGQIQVRVTDILFGTAAEAAMTSSALLPPALFAFQYALAELWTSWGIRPAAVIGHSFGEYVAAAVAGVLRLEDALRLATTRARLVAQLPPGGRMAAVIAGEDVARTAIASYAGTIEVAAINSPTSVVISGDGTDIERVCDHLVERGIEAYVLNISHASHCHRMEPILDDLERAAATMSHAPSRLPLVSNVTGKPIGDEILSARYWREHSRRPVRFREAVAWLYEQGFSHFIEIGPRTTLCSLGRQNDETGQRVWLASVTGRAPERQDLLTSLARLYMDGASVDWAAVCSGPRQIVSLPTYPFERQRHWVTASRPGVSVAHATIVSAARPAAEQTADSPTDAPSPLTPAAETAALDQGWATPPAERLARVAEIIREEVMRVLCLGAHEVPSQSHRLRDLGVDSLMAVELRTRLVQRLHLPRPLPATLVFDYPTIGAVAHHLCSLLEPAAPVAPAEEEVSVGKLAEAIAGLDDEAVAAMVDARLRAL